MSINEASQLVLQAGGMGKAGEIFILDMGEQIKILDLAKELIVLYGLKLEEDIKIKFIGLRPGEKLFEELFNSDEEPQITEHPLINRAVGPEAGKENWETHLDDIQTLVFKRDRSGLIAKFKAIIPNYKPEAI